MTVIKSTLIEHEGFEHGFGTRRTAPGDIPDGIHILRQVHGERIVVLTHRPEEVKRRKGEKGKNRGNKHADASSPHPLIPFSETEVVYRNLPENQFRFDEGDAIISDIPGVSLGIRTADCLPLLVGDRVKGTAAAVHCGWRSLALGLGSKVVMVMTEIMGSRKEHLHAAIGPSIGPCCYEVGNEVRDAFPADQKDKGLFIQRGPNLYLDLASGVKTQLITSGIAPDSVDEIVACTSCSPDRFWSYRARKEEGRMVSFITVREPY